MDSCDSGSRSTKNGGFRLVYYVNADHLGLLCSTYFKKSSKAKAMF